MLRSCLSRILHRLTGLDDIDTITLRLLYISYCFSSDESYHSIGGLMGGPGGGGGGYATTGSIGATAGSGGDAVDECGLRFLLAMRHHTCLMRSLPPVHRAALEEKVSWMATCRQWLQRGKCSLLIRWSQVYTSSRFKLLTANFSYKRVMDHAQGHMARYWSSVSCVFMFPDGKTQEKKEARFHPSWPNKGGK